MDRRAFLSGTLATVGAAFFASSDALAKKPTAKAGSDKAAPPKAGAARGATVRKKGTPLTEVVTSAAGVTFCFEPAHAAYPFGESSYDDASTFVFVPAHFRLSSHGAIDFVVHFHGHNTTAKEALAHHKLREQLSESRQNAVLCVPQGPVRAASGDFGRLMQKGGLGRLLKELEVALRSSKVQKNAPHSGLDGAKSVGAVVGSAHSGGYRALAEISQHGGVNLREIYLFDALYGDVAAFERFANQDDHKLVSYAIGGAPLENNQKLARLLKAKGVAVRDESKGRLTREDLVLGQAIFLSGKGPHGSATFEESALRDCLFASSLKGRGTRSWHKDKTAKRGT